ncbi:hypothetical protein [Mucilaginibacter sp. L196]|uniref:hypothetical protein n=1 Tax=Mucilaginibacter sp. L196 TaxID=1641870 RepID=UPI00131B8C8F|nr:hypothetical protein [Mucilaginibacter sp. L196]
MSTTQLNFSQIPSNVIDILYSNLVAAISASTLIKGEYYRITDYQTVHNLPNVSPIVVNTGPIEAIIVFALNNNTISCEARSESFPSDIISYTINNSSIPGATKGVIYRRIDAYYNVDVPNDFRNVHYRRWKFNPPAFNSASAYNQLDPTLGTDGAVYYCLKPGGFTAGTATNPTSTDDNWVQVYPNNNHYTAYENTPNPGGLAFISNNRNVSPNISYCPLTSTTDFLDSTLFQSYNTNGVSYTNIKFKDSGNHTQTAQLLDLVVYADSGAVGLFDCEFGWFNSSDSNYSMGTIVLASGAYINHMNLRDGIYYSVIQVAQNGFIALFDSNQQMYGVNINTSLMQQVTGSFQYCTIRSTFSHYFSQNSTCFCVFPNYVKEIYALGGLGNLIFNTSSAFYNNSFLQNFGQEWYSDGAYAGSARQVNVTAPIIYKTVLGNFADQYGVWAPLSQMVAQMSGRHISYAYEPPASKTVIDITTGTPTVVTWQVNLVGINLTDMGGTGTSAFPYPTTLEYMTYFTAHGNDFQVQQKDLISGVWTPNNNPTYTIDSVDENNNITQCTFHPNTATGVTETRFIIV